MAQCVYIERGVLFLFSYFRHLHIEVLGVLGVAVFFHLFDLYQAFINLNLFVVRLELYSPGNFIIFIAWANSYLDPIPG